MMLCCWEAVELDPPIVVLLLNLKIGQWYGGRFLSPNIMQSSSNFYNFVSVRSYYN